MFNRLLLATRHLAPPLAVLGVVCFTAYLALIFVPNQTGGDISNSWQAARMLRAGADPYMRIPFVTEAELGLPPETQTPYVSRWYYPLYAAFPAWPLSFLSLPVAGYIFLIVSLATVLLALWRSHLLYLWPMLLSPSFVLAIHFRQWAPLLIAAALVPALGPLLAVKPTIGLALFAYKPNRWTVIGAAVLILVSLMILPTWPLEWLQTAAQAPYPIPVTVLPFGPLLLLSALRWREPRARLLFLSALVPQLAGFYDQAVLMLVCKDRTEAATLSAVSWLGLLIFEKSNWAAVSVAFFYLPALLLVLRPLLSDLLINRLRFEGLGHLLRRAS